MMVSFAELMRIQDELNEAVTPEWRSKIPVYRFEIALFAEMMELADSFPWPWWKPGKEDKENVKIEIVDMTHFLLSLAIKKGCRPFDLEVAFEDGYCIGGRGDLPSLWNLLTDMMVFVKTHRYDSAFRVLGQLVRASGMSPEEFAQLYRGKVKLNLERQRKGYRRDESVKMVDGVEDNRKLLEELAVKKGGVNLAGFHEPYKGDDLEKAGEVGIDGP